MAAITTSDAHRIAKVWGEKPEEINWDSPLKQAQWDRSIGRVTESTSGLIEKEDIGWRRLSGDVDTGRGLAEWSRERLIKTLQWLYYQNPLCGAFTDISKYFVLGSGLDFDIKDDKEREVWTRFWEDPDNNWDTDSHPFFTEWELFGEVLLPVFVEPRLGTVKVGYIHPTRIKAIKTDPKNDRCRIEAVVIRPSEAGTSGDDLKFKLIRQDELITYESSETGPYHPLRGTAFYFSQNAMMTGRGRPTLERDIDWMPTYDEFLFRQMRRHRFQGPFVWDVLCKNLPPAELKQRKQEILEDPPQDGSFLVHNESEEWNPMQPTTGASEAAKDGLEFKRYMGVSTLIPDHLIGAAADVNRATAAEANVPFHRKMESKQKQFRNVWTQIYRFVIDMAVEATILKKTTPRQVNIIFPDFTTKDNLATAQAGKEMVTGLTLAKQMGLINEATMKQAVRLFFMALGEEVPDGFMEDFKKSAAEEGAAGEERSRKELVAILDRLKKGRDNGQENKAGVGAEDQAED